MRVDLDEYMSRVLASLVEAYRAREGMKPRARSISEYELARRLGVTQYTYAQFEASEERSELLTALDELLRRRMIVRAGSSGHYDTFDPADDLEEISEPTPIRNDTRAAAPDRAVALIEQLTRQLDEVIELLRSINRKLGLD